MSNTPPESVAGYDSTDLHEIRQNHLTGRLESEDADKREQIRASDGNHPDSDCESDTSEVLSVGSEPTPTSVVGIDPQLRLGPVRPGIGEQPRRLSRRREHEDIGDTVAFQLNELHRCVLSPNG